MKAKVLLSRCLNSCTEEHSNSTVEQWILFVVMESEKQQRAQLRHIALVKLNNRRVATNFGLFHK
jgi:hypothetical protein